jgi:hypothetical protein
MLGVGRRFPTLPFLPTRRPLVGQPPLLGESLSLPDQPMHRVASTSKKVRQGRAVIWICRSERDRDHCLLDVSWFATLKIVAK